MKKPSVIIIVSSLFLGMFMTSMSLIEMNWKGTAKCQDPASTASTEGCITKEYGYPVRYLGTDVYVSEDNVVYAVTTLDSTALYVNFLVWTAGSLLGLSLLAPHLKDDSVVVAKTKKKSAKKPKK